MILSCFDCYIVPDALFNISNCDNDPLSDLDALFEGDF